MDWLRRYCLSLPHSSEKIQWGSDLVFKIGEKMYAVVALEPGGVWLSFKCTPEDFADLTERPGIIPAPYLARASWVALEREDALPPAEIKRLVRLAYQTVREKLPQRVKTHLERPEKTKRQMANGQRKK